ncbi:hypothetical protein [Paenibacillus sp. MDMC362]|nr:hypothetical protein [Paenibacillus sp. MDMC362]
MRTLHTRCCLNVHVGGSRMLDIVRLDRCLKKSWKNTAQYPFTA